MTRSLTTIDAPPAREDRRRALTARRAHRAALGIDQGRWMTEDVAYQSRDAAKWQARRLIDALVEHTPYERRQLKQRTWRTSKGYRWAVGPTST